jgi:hypothetical protein
MIKMSPDEITSYNQWPVEDHLQLIYKGKLGHAFNVEFSK